MKLVVKRETVVKLFVALGFKTAATWDDARLQKKIKQLPELIDGVKIRNPITKKILKKILEADKVTFKKGEEKESPDSDPDTATEEKTTKSKKKSEEKKVEKKTTTTNPKEKKTATKKKPVEKKVAKKKGDSNKQKVYKCFLKVKPDKAQTHAEKWWKGINEEVKLSTIKSWIGQWKNGKGLPANID